MIEFALVDYLKTKSSVTSIVGSRIYQGRAPQGRTQSKVDARIVYRLLEGSERHYHSLGASGLVEADIELMLTAETYAKARELYEAVRMQIDGFQGQFGDTVIDRCVLTPASQASGDPIQGDDTGYPTVKAVATIHYQEMVPVLA